MGKLFLSALQSALIGTHMENKYGVIPHGRHPRTSPLLKPEKQLNGPQISGNKMNKNDSRYSSYGMGLVKFAAEEKQLFRWLYLEGEQMGPYQNDVLIPEIIDVIMDEFGYSEDVARRFHQDMVYFTYGLAILANTNHLHLTEVEIREAFHREFRALAAIYGKPIKLPDFAVKNGRYSF